MKCTSAIGNFFHFFLAFLFCFLLAACDERTGLKQASEPSSAADLFSADITGANILVFHKSMGWSHDSIPAGIEALQKLADANGFTVKATDDAALFNDTQLSRFNVIVFLNTTRDVLDDNQQIAMERYIQAGGGFVGIHSAADTESEGDWYWYRKLVGAVFRSHPDEPSNIQKARLNVIDHNHPAVAGLPETFELIDEWYDYSDLYPFRKDLLTLDEKSYIGGLHGDYHPITWYHEFDGGRSFYTGLGHTSEIFSDEYFQKLLLKGLRYAVGGKPALDYGKSRPEDNRFVKKTLVENLNEPMSFDFFPDGDAIIAERPGTLQRVNRETGETTEVGKLPVAYINKNEMGLLGVAVDYDFAATQWIYVTYNHQDDSGQLWQRLARFNWTGNQIDNTSEKILLAFKVDENCCHTGGDLQWGNNGELFVSTGDNTNPHEQNGFAPIDFRDGNARNDALRGAGNTQDFRGKILRIVPQPDGIYTIPKGNLFADSSDGLPEIYVMGARNPFTITYDSQTGALYYGDIGPDANQSNNEQGARGHDEINRVTAAGNFGWPLFIGNNKPYVDYDFETATSGKLFNPLHPENKSPRNTGAKQLPPAQPALLWYPYTASEEFPELGSGGRMAMVADVYRSQNYSMGQGRYPGYYDGKLFIVDFMRTWVKAVSLDEFGRVRKIEPFAPQIDYILPIDARFGPDGNLYVLEYGRSWFAANPDSRLARVEYAGPDNRPPVAVITLVAHQAAAPMQVKASALASTDPDNDQLTYTWSLSGAGRAAQALGSEAELTTTLAQAGVYQLQLEVKDTAGSSAATSVQIDVGNAPANIAIALDGNSSFYWPDTKSISYAVTVDDAEDGVIAAGQGNAEGVHVSFGLAAAQAAQGAGHQSAGAALIGKDLVAANGCGACHQIDGISVGPAFRAVADRYKNDPDPVAYLIRKIGEGSSGTWGENAMPGFGHLSEEDRGALASYVLSNATATAPASLPLTGQAVLQEHSFSAEDFNSSESPQKLVKETYELTVNYTDQGGDVVGPIQVERKAILMPARLLIRELEDVLTDRTGFMVDNTTLRAEAGDGQWRTVRLGEFDLTQIKSVQIGHAVIRNDARWEVELRVGGADGQVIAHGETYEINKYSQLGLTLEPTTGKQALYIAARSVNQPVSDIHLRDISFHR